MFREIFLTEIYPRYFEHLKHPDVNPDVYFIGGQPGSGKSVRERVLYNDLNRDSPGTRIMYKGVRRERCTCYSRGDFSPARRRTVNC